MADEHPGVDWYETQDHWDSDPDAVRDAMLSGLKVMQNLDMRIVSEKVTSPVPGVDDPNVVMIHFELEPA
jgi:hypothetical protein